MRKQVRTVSLKDVAAIGSLTLLSRILGFFRELLFVRVLGARMLSDAFLAAFRVPNTLYEIFAGGAIGPALIPEIGTLVREQQYLLLSRMMTFLCACIGTVVLGICFLMRWHAASFAELLVPGFSQEQLSITSNLLCILVFFMFTSTGVILCAEALRARGKVIIPALGQIVINTVFIFGLCWYGWHKPAIETLAWMVVGAGALSLGMHLIAYRRAGYQWLVPQRAAIRHGVQVLWRMVPCMITSGINEIALFIELQFASYLPTGSISLITYASGFTRLPYAILVQSFATVLLPTLVRVHAYAPRRTTIWLRDSLITLFWVLTPVMIGMMWFAYDIFFTLYHSSQFSIERVGMVQKLLCIKVTALLFLGTNHLLLQLFYARRENRVPTLVSLMSAGISIFLNSMLIPVLGIYGVALTGTLTTIMRTGFFVLFLEKRIGVLRASRPFLHALRGIILQQLVVTVPMLLMVNGIKYGLRFAHLARYADTWLLWLWVFPWCLLLAYLLWYTHAWFGIRSPLLERFVKSKKTNRG